jgi:hypothetical protein
MRTVALDPISGESDGMKVNTYPDAQGFLERVEATLELHEAANSLILGVCRRLARHSERIESPPCLKTVEDKGSLVLAAMMTPPHNLTVVGLQGDREAAAATLAADLVSEGWVVPGVLGPAEVAGSVAERLAEAREQRSRLQAQLRVYEVRKAKHPPPERGRLRGAVAPDLELVADWRAAFHAEVLGRADRAEVRQASKRGIEARQIYLWEDGGPVSMAMTTRPTRHGISVSLVYTPAELRGQGYATACVGELSRRLLESGWDFCALFADVANQAAIRVYKRVGYEPVCTYEEYVLQVE